MTDQQPTTPTAAGSPREQRRPGLYRLVWSARGVLGDQLPPAASVPQPHADALALFDRATTPGGVMVTSATDGCGYLVHTGFRLRVVAEMEWHSIFSAHHRAAAGSVLGGVR